MFRCLIRKLLTCFNLECGDPATPSPQRPKQVDATLCGDLAPHAANYVAVRCVSGTVSAPGRLLDSHFNMLRIRRRRRVAALQIFEMLFPFHNILSFSCNQQPYHSHTIPLPLQTTRRFACYDPHRTIFTGTEPRGGCDYAKRNPVDNDSPACGAHRMHGGVR